MNCLDLGIDEACLHIINEDSQKRYEFWSQSEECFECSPWRYLTIPSEKNSSIKVNTTYSSNVFIVNPDSGQVLHRSNFHFVQHGIYQLSFNSSTISSILTLKRGDNEYVSILVAAAFYFALYCFWICVVGLQSRMNEDRRYPRPLINENHLDGEHTEEGSEVEVPLAHASVLSLTQESSFLQTRLKSLDTFRGLSIVMMIFVNYGGGKYFFFKHASWNGLTVADLVFPWFLWAMGVSLVFSVKSHLRQESNYFVIFLKVLKRSLLLYFLGIIVNSLKSNNLLRFRLPGVLQRIAFCYFLNAVLEVFRVQRPESSNQSLRFLPIQDVICAWFQWTVILSLLAVHLAVTYFMPVPGCPMGYLGPGGLHSNGSYSNCTGGAAGYLDHLVFGDRHIYSRPSCKIIYDNPGPYDPEGILGVFTSCLMVQLGVAAGRILFTFPSQRQRIQRFLIWAVFLGLLSGFLCGWSKENGVVPVNKNLWSVSYVCVTGSFAFILFAAFYYVVDAKNKWDGAPFWVAGLNSILLYVGHEICHNVFPWSWAPVGQNHTEHLFMDLLGTSLWIIIAYLCHKKKLYFIV